MINEDKNKLIKNIGKSILHLIEQSQIRDTTNNSNRTNKINW